MGLCKCERKRVTNLFCYEHRVNVCEFCMISSHPKCVVKSYLRWVKDSDFSPNCGICHELLDQPSKDCIRLLCLDVFHVECLNRLALEAPPNVAPAGYLCPSCEHPIIPENNHGGPVAEALRAFLNSTEWADGDFSGSSSAQWPMSNGILANSAAHENFNPDSPNARLLDPHLDYVAQQFLRGQEVQLTNLRKTDSDFSSYVTDIPTSPPLSQRREVPVINSEHYHSSKEDDKYRRHGSIGGILSCFKNLRLNSILPWRARKRRAILVLLVLGILFVVAVSRFNRGAFISDDAFDPHNNPDVHVDQAAAEALRKGLKLEKSHMN